MSKDTRTLVILGVLALICIVILIYRNYTDEDDSYKRRQRIIRRDEKKGN